MDGYIPPSPKQGPQAQPWPTPCTISQPTISQPTVWARLEAPSVPSEALALHSLLLTQEEEPVVESTLLIIKFLPSTGPKLPAPEGSLPE